MVRHIADSHINAYVRCKLALTEEEPTIKPYVQDALVGTTDNQAEAMTSVALIEALHTRWAILLRSLQPADLERRFRYPDRDRPMVLDGTIALYAWRGRHHVAHITELRRREGW